MIKNYPTLIKEREKIYKELTKKFTKEQFRLLLELIDTEIELEKYV